MTDKKQVLNAKKIGQIIRRMAYQVYEANFDSDRLTILGIEGEGAKLSELIEQELTAIDDSLKTTRSLIKVNKQQPVGTVKIAKDIPDNTPILIVDDVMHTGRTIAYCLKELLDIHVPKIDMAVLVDRGHRKFPIRPTFSGYQLATTLEDHIEVMFEPEPGVYLY